MIGDPRAVSGGAGAAIGTSRATAQAGVYGPSIEYRLAEDDAGRLTEDGLDYRVLDGALTLAAAGTASGTSTAAAESTAAPPVLIVIGGGGRRMVEPYIVAARGHAAGMAVCRATGRGIVGLVGRAAGEAANGAAGSGRRYLHDDEILILLEAA